MFSYSNSSQLDVSTRGAEYQHNACFNGSTSNHNTSPAVRVAAENVAHGQIDQAKLKDGNEHDNTYTSGPFEDEEECDTSPTLIAPSEHSVPSTVDELELYDQDAGRNAKALRAILRNMGKDNVKVDVEVAYLVHPC